MVSVSSRVVPIRVIVVAVATPSIVSVMVVVSVMSVIPVPVWAIVVIGICTGDKDGGYQYDCDLKQMPCHVLISYKEYGITSIEVIWEPDYWIKTESLLNAALKALKIDRGAGHGSLLTYQPPDFLRSRDQRDGIFDITQGTAY